MESSWDWVSLILALIYLMLQVLVPLKVIHFSFANKELLLDVHIEEELEEISEVPVI